MAKKIKNQKLEQNELESVTIGAFESRTRSSLSIFIILTLFILIIIFLPQINNTINNFLNKENIPSSPNVTPNKPTTNPKEEEEDAQIYDIDSSLTITEEDLIISKISINNNEITYSLTNPNQFSLNLNNTNYYLELYSADTTLLERIKLISSSTLNTKTTYEYTKKLVTPTPQNITKVSLIKKQTDEYPVYELNNSNSIVCQNDHETITYRFTEQKLSSLTSFVTYQTTDSEYLNLLLNYQNLANNYNNIAGITSTFTSTTENFNIVTSVDLNTAKRQYIFNADTFNKDTSPSIVHFEMSSQGFTCSSGE